MAAINQRIREQRQPTPMTSQQQTLTTVEAEIRYKTDQERCYVVDADGSIMLVKDGDASSATFAAEDLPLVRGKALTHNHPNGGSLSPEDIDCLLTI
ncbi:MAG: hypothetical protein NW237_16980 [Cyanobacteriota bacterium]|nr:hypothetical protein [Cyanobacteriota bacterium]